MRRLAANRATARATETASLVFDKLDLPAVRNYKTSRFARRWVIPSRTSVRCLSPKMSPGVAILTFWRKTELHVRRTRTNRRTA